MKADDKTNLKKKPKVKITFREVRPGSGIMVPQINLGYKTDAVEIIRNMRGHY